MLIDRGFFVDNYVGTYKMIEDKTIDATMIVSTEVSDAKQGEQQLLKKRIFEFDRRDDKYIFLELANVDIDNDDSILDFCNKYGLPYSSQVCYDNESGIAQDIQSTVESQVRRRISGRYSRNDTIDRLEFCRLAVQVNSLMKLKELLDHGITDSSVYPELISLLTYLVFYSRAFIYDFDDTDVLPKTRTMSFQYYFHLFCYIHPKIQIFPEADRIAAYLTWNRRLIENPDRIEDAALLSILMSDGNLRALNIFEKIFSRIHYERANIARAEDLLLFLSGDKPMPVQEENVYIIKSSENQFSIDSYGRISFDNNVEYAGDIDELKQLALEVLCDVVNDGLVCVNPRLILEETGVRGGWQLTHQMEGIYMELFSEFATNSQYRTCANPTCRKFYSVSRSRPNKKFCCHECAALQAKRRERSRKKALSNQKT